MGTKASLYVICDASVYITGTATCIMAFQGIRLDRDNIIALVSTLPTSSVTPAPCPPRVDLVPAHRCGDGCAVRTRRHRRSTGPVDNRRDHQTQTGNHQWAHPGWNLSVPDPRAGRPRARSCFG